MNRSKYCFRTFPFGPFHVIVPGFPCPFCQLQMLSVPPPSLEETITGKVHIFVCPRELEVAS